MPDVDWLNCALSIPSDSDKVFLHNDAKCHYPLISSPFMRLWRPRCLRRHLSFNQMVVFGVGIVLLVVVFRIGLGSVSLAHRQTPLKLPRIIKKTQAPSSNYYGLWDKNGGVNLSSIYEQTIQARRKAFQSCGDNWQDEYSTFHETTMRSGRTGRFLIYSCRGEGYGCAGYGNRIGGIASLLLLAVLTNRVFLIDWNEPKSLALERFLLPNKIQWNYNSTRVKDLQSRTHYWGKGLPRNLQHYVKPSNIYPEFAQWFQGVDFHRYFDRPIERITATWNFGQEIWSNPYLARKADKLGMVKPALKHFIVRCSYDFLFRRSPNLENKLAEVKRTFNSTKVAIGLHIRMGDTVFGRQRPLNTRNFKSFFSCALLVEESIVQSNVHVKSTSIKWFLATDDLLVKKYAIKRFPGKILTLDIVPEHIGIFQKERFPSYEGTDGVFLDHFMLAECFFLILSYSTFGTSALGVHYHAMHSFTFGERCGIVTSPRLHS